MPGASRKDAAERGQKQPVDFLLACSERVQESVVFFSVAHLLNLEVDVIFFDTTSTYFETDPDGPQDAPDSEDASSGEEPLRIACTKLKETRLGAVALLGC
jgi:hypothetical protein